VSSMHTHDGRPGESTLSDAKRALLEKRLRGQAAGAAKPHAAIPKLAHDGPTELSFAQERLWVLDRLEPGKPVYNLAAVSYLVGPLDVDVLGRTLSEILRRHEALRTVFPMVDGRPVQQVVPAYPVEIEMEEVPEMPEAERDAYLRRRLREEGTRPFDLATGPLFRVRLYRLSPTLHAFHTIKHHIVTDGWSMGALSYEMDVIYRAFAAGEPSPLPDLPIQYRDYAAWQREYLRGDTLQRQLDYWKRHLEGVPDLELPTDRPRPPVESHRGAFHRFVIPPETTAGLQALSRREGVTLNMTLSAAFAVLLGRYSGQDDFAVGTLIGNRNRAETEGLIGFFVNTAAVRVDLGGDPDFLTLLRRVRGALLDADAHQDLPFEKVVEAVRSGRDLSRHPVFQALFFLHAFVVQNAPMPSPDLGEVRFASLDPESGIALQDAGVAKFDLSLGVVELGNVLSGIAEYALDLFDESTIVRMMDAFLTLLTGVVEHPERSVHDLPLLTGAERDRLVRRGATGASAGEPFIVRRFERAAAETPEAVALVQGERKVTYGELHRGSNRLARHLRGLGVGPEARVGICMERSPGMVEALLGVLKAGGAYVPLDPAYPAERLAFMVRDAGIGLLLADEHLADGLTVFGVGVVRPVRDRRRIDGESDADLAVEVAPDGLFCVLYTSGSTGEPKGAEIPHRAVPGFFSGVDYLRFDAGEVFLQYASPSWDVLTLELWPALSVGAKCVLYSGRTPEPARLAEEVRAHGVTTLWMTSAFFNLVVDTAPEVLAGLSQLVAGGEALSAAHVRRALQANPELRLVDGYGPSECTVFAACYRVPRDFDAPTVPIGTPVGDRRVYVLDRHLSVVPEGVPGELCVGGPAVARGYLGRPGLTAERFVPDPFGEPGARLYRSGDRARWRADGTLEFLGRMDRQVKVRGFRIEPGEVEAVLLAHAGVRRAAVVAREDAPGDRLLVAYLVPEGEAPDPAALRSFLSGRLPEYMIPGGFVTLDALPLTANGKLDRSSLPPLDGGAGAEHVPPRTPAEEAVAAIWREVLGIESVGVRDDFFLLGGHSLRATQVVSRFRDRLGVDLPLRAVFETPTVEGLAAWVKPEDAPAEPSATEPEGTFAFPLSFAQQRLWFVDQMAAGSHAYNVTGAYHLSGRLDADALERAVNEVVLRHESLRTTFTARGGEPLQVIHPWRPVPLPRTDLAGMPPAELEAEVDRKVAEVAATSFDLAVGPLFRAELIRMGPEENVFTVGMHHIVSDGWSAGVFHRELRTLYEAFTAGLPSPLPELEIQYADFAVWQREQLEGETLERQLSFWRERLRDAPTLDLPTDRPRPPTQTFRGAACEFLFPREMSDRLRAVGERERATLFMVLMAAWQLLLSRWSGQDDVVVGTPIAGRNRQEIEGLIGFFVNTLVIRTDLSGRPSFRELVGRVRDAAFGAYAHQDLPFEKIVEEVRPERDPSRSPVFQVVFVLQNAPGEEMKTPGLEWSGWGGEAQTAKFDLTLGMHDGPQGLSGVLEFNTDLFDQETVLRLAERLDRVLEAVSANPDCPIDEVSLLGPEERERLAGWSRSGAADAPARCVHELFAEQAARRPDAVALAYGGERIRYAELDRRADLLAAALRRLGVRPDARVGICMERSPEMVEALLGVLKAGGAYVPLDPEYPADRLAYMLTDSGARVVLTTPELRGKFEGFDGEVVEAPSPPGPLYPASGRKGESDTSEGEGPAVTPDHLAYVIYTSGSTGEPKGTEVPHRAIPGYFRDVEYARFDHDLVTLQHSSTSWDALTLELWTALLSGGTCVLYPGRGAEPGVLASQVREHGVNTLWLTSAYFNLIVDTLPGALEGVEQVMVGGEAISVPHVRRALETYPGLRLVNGYGPSECTVFSACHPVPRDFQGHAVPIGRPVGDRRVYVLDRHLSVVPEGVPGELCVGGPAVARGYLGRPALTAERFVPDPFGEPGARLYRSGDRARWRADGTLEYLGRMDHQVKLRGFRVEPGEVEAALARLPGVREATAVVREDAPGDRRLVGYVVADDPGITGQSVRAALAGSLPEYMVPSAVVVLEALPLTSRGKVDRRALPAPELGPDADSYVAPRTAVEARIAEIWSAVLKVERVGVHDRFFDLGGHSLLATQVVTRIREAFSADLPLRVLFETPTVAALAARVEADRQPEPEEERILPQSRAERGRRVAVRRPGG